ncbi:ABC transporter family substrate-binding protein [Demequina sp. NBRC 110052]|uniref:ABC transporter family substrate-binding protein n=1 Tax=Demequina sp. NBRC 110052 TaxID=1570341 RepID=UPI0013563BFF|nr:ABC transporter family substrate-binding protein [Demequina sp. NBRC 110052]
MENTAVTVAWNQPLYSLNSSTSSGNATANAVILYMTQQSFNYYNADQELIDNTDFGTMELVSEEPMTVSYDLADGVTWSDGVAVDNADLLLNWAALSGYFNEGEPEYDEETGVIVPNDAQVWFDSVVYGTAISNTELPEITEDGTFELTYTEPSIDWKLNMTGVGVPAHVVAQRALGIEDADEAKQAVIDAIMNSDTETLVKLANVWNLDFDIVEMPAEEDLNLLVGNGPYEITDFVQDEYITLSAREGFTAGPAPSVETITVRYVTDPLASIQAIQNGEISITQPQATSDILEAAQALGDSVVVDTEPEAVYEHIDLNFANGGPFDPATYGGDAETAKLVRQAFITAIDVNEVLDKLIVPLQEDAKWNQSQVFLPGAPGYEDSIANNGSEVYGQGDAEAALALLEQAGVETPVDVNMLYASNNTRRVNEFTLYQAQLAEAGFNLIDGGNESWGSLLGTPDYDAWFFGWQSTSTSPLGAESIFRSDGGSNFTGYANDAVDAAYTELSTTFDEDRQIELLQQIDAELWNDAYGITVFQFPGVTVYDADMTGVSTSPLSPTIFWNYWEWGVPAAE